MERYKLEILKDFVAFCIEELNIQETPNVVFTKDKNWVAQYRSFGEYHPASHSVRVFYLGRNLADVCRSLAHELTHHRQNELGMISDTSGNTGTEIENEANAMAGILMRDYGKLNIKVYDLDTL